MKKFLLLYQITNFKKVFCHFQKKVQEVDFRKQSFIDDLCELRLEEELSLEEKVEFEATLKKSFLICD